jgi:hypothetical protein
MPYVLRTGQLNTGNKDMLLKSDRDAATAASYTADDDCRIVITRPVDFHCGSRPLLPSTVVVVNTALPLLSFQSGY